MRARNPDRAGSVDRDGVAIHYEVYGDGEPTLLLIPSAPITHSRIWKGSIPYLARSYRVVTFDGRGNGGSGRPTDPAEHTATRSSSATSTPCSTRPPTPSVDRRRRTATPTGGRSRRRRPIPIGCGPWWPSSPASLTWADRSRTGSRPAPTGTRCSTTPTGWELNNRHAIVTRHRDWIEFFFGQQLVEPHSTKQYEDAVGWALESTGEVLAAAEDGFEIGPARPGDRGGSVPEPVDPHAHHPRRPRHLPARRPGQGIRRDHRWRAGGHRGRRPPGARPRPGARSTASIEGFRRSDIGGGR